MTYAADRFLKGSFNTRRSPDAAVETFPLYSYGSHAKLYDVLVVDGAKFYRVNMGAWANTIDKITPAHASIEQHFAI